MDFGVNNSYLLIDTQKIRQNISRLVETLPKGTELYPVLKCDAYGLGLEPIASIIGEFSEIKTIAVAQVQEGLRLRESGIKQDISNNAKQRSKTI